MRPLCDDQTGPVWRILLAPAEGEADAIIDNPGLEQLLALVKAADESPSCRIIVLEGQGDTFCRGMDLEVAARDTAAEVAIGVPLYIDILKTLHRSGKITIAAVDGAAMAGGVGLCAVCDLCLATERSSFGLAEIMLGLVPVMVVAVLLERVSVQQARALALCTVSIDGPTALRIGLVDQLVADSEKLERALRAELKNLLRVQPAAAAALKGFVRAAATSAFGDRLDAARQLTAERMTDPAVTTAIRQFLDGEPLPWFARYRPRKP